MDNFKLEKVLSEYKKYFPKFLKYKWEALRHFKEHWNFNAPNFDVMFEAATEKTANLLSGWNYFPRGTIIKFAKSDAASTKKLFITLISESMGLQDRIETFINGAGKINEKRNNESWKDHFQDVTAVSIYLWLLFPEKFYIYNHDETKKAAALLGANYDFKESPNISGLFLAYEFYDELNARLRSSDEFYTLIKTCLPQSYEYDPELKTMTSDLIYFLCNFYTEEVESKYIPPTTLVSKQNDNQEDVNYFWFDINPKILTFSSLRVGEKYNYTLFNPYNGNRSILHSNIETNPGDLIIGFESYPVKKVVALAKINKVNENNVIFFEKTENLISPVDYSVFENTTKLRNMEYFVNQQGNLFKLTRSEYDIIIDLIRAENPSIEEHTSYPQYTLDDFIVENYLSAKERDTLISLIKTKKNVIIRGVPGVGKTFVAKRIAYTIIGEKDENRIKLIQFHPKYTYEDFVLGYRQWNDNYELVKGVFYDFCERADNQPHKDFFFLIDEINRGDVGKIFGEILMLIEKNYRGTKTTLVYNNMSFFVPQNVYIIGMMNTADKEYNMSDYVLRRRFAFYDLEPAYSSEGFKNYQNSLNNEKLNIFIEKIVELNRDISSDPNLGKGFCIGHSYFCNLFDVTDTRLLELLKYDITPMIEEYWVDNQEKLNYWIKTLNAVFD